MRVRDVVSLLINDNLLIDIVNDRTGEILSKELAKNETFNGEYRDNDVLGIEFSKKYNTLIIYVWKED